MLSVINAVLNYLMQLPYITASVQNTNTIWAYKPPIKRTSENVKNSN